MTSTSVSDEFLSSIQNVLHQNCRSPVMEVWRRLSEGYLDDWPQPGKGQTIKRWRYLAAIAQHDLSLAKLVEGHTDALAILWELDCRTMVTPGARWGTWAAESPSSRVVIQRDESGHIFLSGTKCWCSGAQGATHALLTAWWADDSSPQLVSVKVDQPGVTISSESWRAVGMADSASVDVSFNQVQATLVGPPGAYLSRPGFWQGGAGIAACWFGGCQSLASALHQSLAAQPSAARAPMRLAALGKVDVAMGNTAALLRETATWIDANPHSDASLPALRVRQSAEATARVVLDEVGRAMGATPFCRDERFARMAADLPVFIRQSHAGRDDAALAERLLESHPSARDL